MRLFAIFSWSDGAWNVACVCAGLCLLATSCRLWSKCGNRDLSTSALGCMILGYSRFWRRMASSGLGQPEIISIRASGIFLLCRKAWWSVQPVAVSLASGYSFCLASVVRVGIGSRHILWRGASQSKMAVAGGIYFWRTSLVRYRWLAGQVDRTHRE